MLKKKKILGIEFTDADLQSILEYVIEKLKNNERKFYIVTPNPEILMIARKNSDYQNMLNHAEIALADGVGVLFAGQTLGSRLKERIAGVDFMEKLCKGLAKQPITVGFLGGREDVADRTAKCLKEKYAGLNVEFALGDVPNNLSALKCDMLFVAFGSPKQEKWIYENLESLPIKVAMGVGGAFDMISGRTPRAPMFLRKLSLEWLFRLLIQPWRIKRQLQLLKFVIVVILERLRLFLYQGRN